MRPLNDLTPVGQVRRLRAAAIDAIGCFGLEGADLRLVQHGENTIFRAAMGGDGNEPYLPGQYAVRVSGAGYQRTRQTIESEGIWMAALSAEGFAVPQPLFTAGGETLVEVDVAGAASPRFVTVTRWLGGRSMARAQPSSRYAAVGALTASLHEQASRWKPPSGFDRQRWDWDGLFGESIAFGEGTATKAWSLVPQPHRRRWQKVASRLAAIVDDLGTSDGFGLIHADLHRDNMLFHRGRIHLLDFDDCGWGWQLYDIAVAMSEGVRTSERWDEVLEAFLRGYQEVRAVPAGIELLDEFIAARWVTVGLWIVGMGQINTRFAEMVPKEIAWIAEDLDAIDR